MTPCNGRCEGCAHHSVCPYSGMDQCAIRQEPETCTEYVTVDDARYGGRAREDD